MCFSHCATVGKLNWYNKLFILCPPVLSKSCFHSFSVLCSFRDFQFTHTHLQKDVNAVFKSAHQPMPVVGRVAVGLAQAFYELMLLLRLFEMPSLCACIITSSYPQTIPSSSLCAVLSWHLLSRVTNGGETCPIIALYSVFLSPCETPQAGTEERELCGGTGGKCVRACVQCVWFRASPNPFSPNTWQDAE